MRYLKHLSVLTLGLILAGHALAQGPTEAQLAKSEELARWALEQNLGYEIVESLTTEVGARLAGTEAEERARQWAVTKLKKLGFKNVRVEHFDLPVWERGLERAEILAPYPQALVITSLGGSTSTGHQGVEGDVVGFSSLAALKAADADTLKGKIAYIGEVMTRTQDGSGYGVAGAKRREAAYVAKEKGALAVLIRSVGTSSHRFAHTGQMRRVTSQPIPDGVPAAALAAPDADQLERILASGKTVTLHLLLTPETRPAGRSGNVIAEIPGKKKPEEIVLLGAHLDSWDMATGAVDDGAGVGIVVAAAKHLMDETKRPERTVRVVLFGAEEVGLVGGKAYVEMHKDELKNHVIASESDFGAGRIWRFETRAGEGRVAAAQALGHGVRMLGAAPGGNAASGGPDLLFMRGEGVPVVTLKQNGWDYFDLHHTPNDTLDKIHPADLAHNVAAWLSFVYLAANTGEYYR
ncbi:M20/M25/M40 family metallo-hydrolase [Halioglobus maricola]|uniref:Carboxypeptidase Q n=1 Tax=Halioglobus maricola TaxID=2601894 RepID=A0A5P9NHD7_9GAMM|nr:M20/M25/M40 family metallo-hydrolase [Halioglobus maricola]QFU75211.1 M20/M25/M40 family metallo-hydrolase [Halioglobus maricola]